MRRDYVIRRAGDIDQNVDAEKYLARTVHEEIDLIDIGLLDCEGNKVLVRKRMDPIGYVRWREK